MTNHERPSGSILEIPSVPRKVEVSKLRTVRALTILFLVILSNGCAGYKLGPTNGLAAGDKSVQVIPFTNTTLEPHLGDSVTAQMRKAVQRDGTFKLATHDDGDILVGGAITG